MISGMSIEDVSIKYEVTRGRVLKSILDIYDNKDK